MKLENEQWWSEHGKEWVEEIESRRKTQPLYAVQELVLSDYFASLPVGSKVLEFGAGFGRHAKYLKNLDNIEYYVVDQSPTMLEAYEKYVPSEMKETTLIEPKGKLPYPDKFFDVVFTVSVLIHILPDDLDKVIQEIHRVAKHVVLHFENKYTETSRLAFKDHGGCWQHNIPRIYLEKVKVIDCISEEQDLYVVSLTDEKDFQFCVNDVLLDRIAVNGKYLTDGLKALQGEVGWRQQRLEFVEEEKRKLEGEIGWRQQRLETVESENRILLENLEKEMRYKADLENKIKKIKNNVIGRVIYNLLIGQE